MNNVDKYMHDSLIKYLISEIKEVRNVKFTERETLQEECEETVLPSYYAILTIPKSKWDNETKRFMSRTRLERFR